MSDRERRESMVPDWEEAPVSARGQDSPALLSRLAEAEDHDDQDFVPGTQAPPGVEVRSEPGLPPTTELAELAEQIEFFALGEAAALSQGRALAVAAQLWTHLGATGKARDAAREASSRAPKLGTVGLVYRKLAATHDDLDHRQKQLEATARLAVHPATRTHAALLLSDSLLEAGEDARASALLDHAARSGSPDPRVALERLLLRLSTSQSIGGIDAPEALQRAAGRVQETLGGRPSDEPDGKLQLLRAVRALERADTISAADTLISRPEAALSELGIALLQTKPDHRERARALLAQLVGAEPSRSLVRSLAAALVEAHEHQALASLLAQVEPSPGTFSPTEEWLLRALSGGVATPHAQSLTTLIETSPELSQVLAPLSTELDPLASTTRQGAALGTLLVRLDPTPEALARLGALEGLANERLVSALLRLDLASASGEPHAASQALLDLDRELGDESLRLLAAWTLEQSGATEPAAELYRSLLPHAEFGLAALRGLLALTPEANRTPLLQEHAASTSEHEREADASLEAALAAPGEGGARAILSTFEIWKDPALLLAASSLAELRGDDPVFEEALERTSQLGDPILTHLSKVRALLRVAKADPNSAATGFFELAAGDEQGDVSLASTAEFFAALGGDPTPHVTSRELRDRTPSAFRLANTTAELLVAGDDERALATLLDLAEHKPSPLLSSIIDELREAKGDVARLSERWLLEAKTDDPQRRRYAYARLSELDRMRGDQSSSVLWRRSAVEEFPTDLSALIQLEDLLLFEGRMDEWGFVRDRLAQQLPAGDREAYQVLGAALALGQLDLREARRHVEPLLLDGAPPLLALRTSWGSAKERGDDPALLELGTQLLERSTTDLDRATLCLDIAYAYARTGQHDQAREFTRRALLVRPDLFAARLLDTHLALEAPPALLAESLEQLAAASHVTAHQAAFWVDAGLLWLEAEEPSRAITSLVRALEAEPAELRAFEELSELYLERGALPELCELLQARLQLDLEPPEQLDLRLRIAEILLELESPERARSHLERALEQSPHAERALRAHALVCSQLGEHHASQQSLARLESLLDEGPEKIAVLRSLGSIYETELGEFEKAMDAYEAVLDRTPDDRAIERRLVGVFARLGLAERATNLQTKLIQSATLDEEKRKGALLLAELYEGIGRDPKRAGATLERALKAWPLDGEVLEATAHFMDRQGETNARRVLVDRVGKEAKKSLEATRLDASVLDTLGRAARLSEIPAQAEAINAVRAAFLGEAVHYNGGGARALDPALDELLAPPLLSAPLRNLLKRTGSVLDTAFSIDLSALAAQRVHDGPAVARLSELSASLGGPPPEVFVATSLGSRCLPVTTTPLRFVVGPGFGDLPEGAQSYLMYRAFKLQQLGAAALARSRAEDAWPMLAALLLLFAPTWRPRGVDARKVAQARALVEQGLARVGYDDDVPVLALEAIGALGDQGEQIGDAVRALAQRSALLAVGDPGAVLEALAAGTDKPLPPSGPSRFRWLEAHAEAKGMLLFTIGDEHTRAREHLGLAAPRAQRAPLPPRLGSLGPLPPRRG